MYKFRTPHASRDNEKQASYRTDDEFRKSRRNLLWIGSISLLFSIARADPSNRFLINLNVLSSSSGFDRGLIAIGLFVSVIYFWIQFRRELTRVIRTLNSSDAIESLISGGEASELASLAIRKRARECQETTIAAYKQLYSDVSESLSNVPTFFIEREIVRNLISDLKALANANDEGRGNIAHALAGINRLSADPMGFPLSTPEREEFEKFKKIISNSLPMLSKFKDLSESFDIDNKVRGLEKVEYDPTLARIERLVENLSITLENLNSSQAEIERRLKDFDDFAKNFEGSERRYFNFLEVWFPQIVTLCALFGLFIWIIVWAEWLLKC